MPASNRTRSPNHNLKATPRIVPLCDSAIAIEFENEIDPEINARVVAYARHVAYKGWSGILDIVPTYRSITIHFDPFQWDFAVLIDRLEGLSRHTVAEPESQAVLHEIPVLYGDEWGPDLEDVATFANLLPAQAVALHASIRYRVYMLGFSPGFPYLGLLHKALAMPRLSTPRMKVPAGSVGIADRQTGIYPSATPGGWRLIGRTPTILSRRTGPTPFLLKPGDLVQFRPIDRNEFDRLSREAPDENH